MGRTIWKYRMMSPLDTTIDMPQGAKILHVAEHNGFLCLWAEVEPTAPPVTRNLIVYGTGHAMPDNPGKYLGSAAINNRAGILVFYHLYELEG